MELNEMNYFSHEADVEYFSASQIKSFKRCEAQTMAALRGDYVRPMSTALMVGQYVDESLTGDFLAWREKHPEILKRDGSLKADFEGARLMVERALRDPLFMDYMEGDHQTILKAPILGGYWFKAKLDVLAKDRIVDLKTVRDLKSQYLPGQGRVDFATAWDWPLQMAIYQKIYEEVKGVRLPCYLAVITKETPADIRIVQIEQERMDAEIAWLEQVMPRYEAVKNGAIDPERCETCEWCRESRILMGPELLGDFDENGGIEE
jgi:hypothetical protein